MKGNVEHKTPPRPRQSRIYNPKKQQPPSHQTTPTTSPTDGDDTDGRTFMLRSGKPPLSPVIRRVINHPLDDTNGIMDSHKNNGNSPQGLSSPLSPGGLSAASHEPSSPSAYAAALVQSAAKSVLDTSTTTVSDDEYDDDDDDSIIGRTSNNNKSKSLPASPLIMQHHQNQHRRRRVSLGNSNNNHEYDNLLYDSTHDTDRDNNTQNSDDNDDDPLQLLSSPTLQSLQTKTLPALPDKHDRKRFIGCIAAILSKAYDFESTYYNNNVDGDNVDNKSSSGNKDGSQKSMLVENDADNIADSFAYLDDDEDDCIDNSVVIGKGEEDSLINDNLTSKNQQHNVQDRGDMNINANINQNIQNQEDETDGEDSHTSGRRRRPQQQQQINFMKKSLRRPISRSDSSFDYYEVSDNNVPQPQSLEVGAKRDSIPEGENKMPPVPPPPPPPPQLSEQEQQQQQLYAAQQRQTSGIINDPSMQQNYTTRSVQSYSSSSGRGNSSASLNSRPSNRPIPPQPPLSSSSSSSSSQPSRRGNRRRDAAILARNRHRLRRYELLSNFLLSSADYFEMDRMHAKAFLPMMTRLLAPQRPPTAPSSTTTKTMGSSSASFGKPMSPPPSNGSSIGGLEEGGVEMTDPAVQQQQQQQSKSNLDTSNSPLPNPGGYDGTKTDSPPSSDIGITLSSSAEDNTSPYNNKSKMTPSSSKTGTNNTDRCFIEEMDQDESLRPFLESLTPGSGFRCLALLLLQHLLQSNQGYDARIRHVMKKIGVIVLVSEMKRDPYGYLPDHEDDGGDNDGTSNHNKSSSAKYSRSTNKSVPYSDEVLVDIATRKFESLEHAVAWKLLHQLSDKPSRPGRGYDSAGDAAKTGVQKRRAQIVRGLKIGSAGLLAGTLFAVTGGLAAPGIAAGVAAIAGSTAAVVTLTSTAAVTAIFGVGGGGLAAYKMHRRTNGLTEFAFQKESGVVRNPITGRRAQSKEIEAELFSTICLSGWLRDQHDFQRPWGCEPTNPRLVDRLEQLERFYAIYKPDYVSKCARILAKWRGEERQLWAYLKQTYGCDPSNLFPLEDGPRRRHALTHEQDELLDKMFAELGFISAHEDDYSNNTSSNQNRDVPGEGASRRKAGWKQRFGDRRHPHTAYEDSFSGGRGPTTRMVRTDSIPVAPELVSTASSGADSMYTSSTTSSKPNESSQAKEKDKEKEKAPPKHVSTVWDYQSMYGGELYTVKWESDLLLELSDSVDDMALDMVGGATAQILRQTALSTLMSAIALPYALVSAANMIDGTWTLMIERAEEAGKELAKSLLFSRAGHRPVTLVGYSMGARVIYTCLKELARYQEIWEEMQLQKSSSSAPDPNGEGSKQPSRQKPRRTPNGEENLEKMREPAGIVEDAILMGMPNHLSLSSWVACRQVVAGRLVNCFSRKDYILSLMFQFKRLMIRPVCGTCPVEIHGVENIDVTDLISGHKDYCLVVGDILKRVRHGQPLRHLE